MRIDGQCHCGHIAYEAEIDPDRVSICHCRDCQQMTGPPTGSPLPPGQRIFA